MATTDTVAARAPDRGARVAEILEKRAQELTERWHQELEERLRIRPQNVFRGSRLLDGMPELIRWIAGAFQADEELSAARGKSAHDLARFWRESGYSIEESLLHVRLLETLLHEALREALEQEGANLSVIESASLSEQLSKSLGRIETVLVGTYRDAEEERFLDFGGTLAHEIRGQLNVAMTAAELLRVIGADPTEEARVRREDAIERVTGAVGSAADLVTAVQRFSRVRSGLREWTLEPFDAVVREVIDGIERESGADVAVHLETDVPSTHVPAEAMRLALHNLVENAVKYADPGKEERWVRIHVLEESEDGQWRVQVGDNGIGIPEQEQARVFARFLRGSRAEGAGFGLGLSIARQAALSMGGTVMLESREGQGSTFSFTVPFTAADPDSDPVRG